MKRRLLAFACMLGLVAQPALAGSAPLPVNGQVVAGSAAIGSNGNLMTVDQSSRTAVVNWQDFSIGAGNGVTFNMPSTDSAILNRVTGNEASTIAGSLSGNGQVYVVNQNGIAITGTGTVKVGGGFVASSLGISDEDFIAGKRSFAGTSNGTVSNSGSIEAGEGGFVGLISNNGVENDGLISVPAGKVGLGTGSAITLDPNGNGFLQIAAESTMPGGGKGVTVNGKIHAHGGRVEVKASSIEHAVRDLVNIGGEINVSSVRKVGGTIILGGGKGGVKVAGHLKANSMKASGGRIAVGGDLVVLQGATIEAKGANGGSISLGGGRHGASMPEAETANGILIDASTLIDASGSEANGGEVIVWSNRDTRFLGQITATGVNGNGGDAEVSSHGAYDFNGRVNLLSGAGKAGNLLLDPYNLTISSAASANQSGFTANGSGATINVTSLTTALAGANVTVSTGSSGAESGDITVSSAISWSANTTLTLSAAGSIFVNANINQNGASGSLVLTAGGASGVSGAAQISTSGTTIINETNSAANGQLTVGPGGPGTLTFNGPAAAYVGGIAIPTLTVVGDYNFSGKIVIASGVMAFKAASATNYGRSNTSEYNIQSGAVMQVGSSLAQYYTWSNSVNTTFSGTGTLQKVGTGSYSMNSGGNSTTTWKMGAGGLVDIRAGTFTNLGGQTSWINNYADLNVATGATFTFGSGTATANMLTGGGSITGSGSLTVGNNNGTSTFSGVYSGTGALAKAGSGTFTLTGINTFSGATNVNGGMLQLGGSGKLASGSYSGAISIASGASFEYSSSASQTLSGVISGAGSLIKDTSAASTLTLSGANTYSGTSAISAGTLKAGTVTAFSSNSAFTISAGAFLDLAGCANTVGSLAGAGTVTNSSATGTVLTVGALNTSTSFSGTLQNGTSMLGLTKSGTGTLTLSGANSYTGTTTVNAGTLALADTSQSHMFWIVSGAVLQVGSASNYTFDGASTTITGSGTLRKVGAGTLAFGTTGQATTWQMGANGLIDVQAGALVGSATAADIWTANSSSLNIQSGASFEVSGSKSIYVDALTGSGTLDFAGGSLNIGVNNASSTFDGGLAGGANIIRIAKQGSGSITLTGNMTGNANAYLSTYGGNLTLTGSIDVGSNQLHVFADAAGGVAAVIAASGQVTSGELWIGGLGTLSLTGSNRIDRLKSDSVAGDLVLNNSQSLTIGSFSVSNRAVIHASGAGSDLTLDHGASIQALGAGDALILGADRHFINNSSASAITMSSGRWLVYSAEPAGDVFGSLDSGNRAVWNTAWGTLPTVTGNRYVFASRPLLTVSPVSTSKTYGQDASSALATAYGVSGYQGVANAYADDDPSAILSGAASVTSAGAAASAHVGTYALSVSQGSLVASGGYTLAFASPGILTVNKAALTITGNTTSGLTYDGTTRTNGFTISGLVAGDSVTGVSGLASGSAVGTYGDTLANAAGSGLGNYDIIYHNGSLTISKAHLLIAGGYERVVLDGASHMNTYSVTGLFAGDHVDSVSGRAMGNYAGIYADALSTAFGTGLSNYDIDYVNGALTIVPQISPTGSSHDAHLSLLLEVDQVYKMQLRLMQDRAEETRIRVRDLSKSPRAAGL